MMLDEKTTVLLVDDDVQVLYVHEYMLLRLGANVITANDGEEGIEIFNRKRGEIGLVITDYIMPGMDGFKFAKRVREKCLKTPIALCTGYAEGLIASELECLDIMLLNKPMRMAAFQKLLE